MPTEIDKEYEFRRPPFLNEEIGLDGRAYANGDNIQNIGRDRNNKGWKKNGRWLYGAYVLVHRTGGLEDGRILYTARWR